MRTLFVSWLMLFSLSGCGGGGGGGNGTSSPAVTLTPERVMISGAGDLGIFDPAVSFDPATGDLWMSYSSVETSMFYAPAIYWAVSTRLAFSVDNGVSWQDAGMVVAPKVEAIVGPMSENHPTGSIPAGSQGIWQSETSSLIYDPSAPIAERWKLLWSQYLNANLTSYFADHSWIAMKMAPTPLDLASATAVKLFGGAGLQADGANTGSPVFSPIGGAPAIQLNVDLTTSIGNQDLAELNLCIFAEPGLHATSSAVYMAIYCADASTTPITEYLVYFRCPGPCDMTSASSWEYLGRLLSPTDAQVATGDHHYQAPALVEKNGVTYLLTTPVDSTSDGLYDGCRVYEFIDIESNQLRRSNGQLVEVSRIDGDSGTHNGACTDFSNLQGGTLLSQSAITGSARTFSIYKSQVNFP